MKITKNIYQKYVKTFEPGEVLFNEGEQGDVMFIIIQGEVEIRKQTSSKTSRTLITFHEGDIFGEMALVEKKPRSATAIAVTPCRTLVMNEALLDNMIENNPDFAKKMIRILSERIRKANLIIQNIVSTNRQNQIYNGLKTYAQKKGISTFKGHRVKLSEFHDWARSRLGISEKETKHTVADLLKRRILAPSAVGKEEIIVNLNRQLY
ncbi:MAG: cyclic nucleotide-binding domain-containing protein [Spirochaetaceae bacterium]|nr:MAG: cyclic nucleotide-binding domain-containing protein [Spirochaetaceae bacterium]